MREAATMPGRVSTAGMGVAESFASDLDERALDMVLGAEVANQQYKVEITSTINLLLHV